MSCIDVASASQDCARIHEYADADKFIPDQDCKNLKAAFDWMFLIHPEMTSEDIQQARANLVDRVYSSLDTANSKPSDPVRQIRDLKSAPPPIRMKKTKTISHCG